MGLPQAAAYFAHYETSSIVFTCLALSHVSQREISAMSPQINLLHKCE